MQKIVVKFRNRFDGQVFQIEGEVVQKDGLRNFRKGDFRFVGFDVENG